MDEHHILIHITPRNACYIALSQEDLDQAGRHRPGWLNRRRKGYGATPWEAVLDLAQKKVAHP